MSRIDWTRRDRERLARIFPEASSSPAPVAPFDTTGVPIERHHTPVGIGEAMGEEPEAEPVRRSIWERIWDACQAVGLLGFVLILWAVAASMGVR